MSENFFGDRGFHSRRARAYDAMLGSPTCNRVCWGTRPDQYAAFAARAIGSVDGPLLEVGVGTARATALLHVAGRRPTTLVDLNTPMLEVARESIHRAAGGEVQGRISLECRDMLSPPEGRRYETILGLGLLHLASLVRGSARSNACLKLLKAHGDIAGIRTAADLHDLAVAANVGAVSVAQRGAMAYVVILR